MESAEEASTSCEEYPRYKKIKTLGFPDGIVIE
jgi:hypothetical protein